MSAIVRGDCVRLRAGQRMQINFREPLFAKHLCSCCAHAAVTSDRLLPQHSCPAHIWKIPLPVLELPPASLMSRDTHISSNQRQRCNEIGGIKIEEKSDVGLDE